MRASDIYNVGGEGALKSWHAPAAVDVLDVAEIRDFLQIIHKQAAQLAAPLKEKKLHPGRLQLDFINPFDGTTIPHRYDIGDVDRMVKDAIRQSETGWNIYVEGRTVSSTKSQNRGRFASRANLVTC